MAGTGRTELTDVVCPMYPSVGRMIRMAARSDEDRPVILCEYSHSMGNSNGNLHLYWKEFWNPAIPQLQGGFIWDMVDQGIRVKNAQRQEYFAYGGDFSDRINDAQFCLNVRLRKTSLLVFSSKKNHLLPWLLAAIFI
jgi:beta-galactosidase